jgi:hypothetical protein
MIGQQMVRETNPTLTRNIHTCQHLYSCHDEDVDEKTFSAMRL